MKLRKVIQAGLTKNLATSKSSHVSQYTALRRNSGFQQIKLPKIIQARLTKSLATSKASYATVTSSASEQSLLSSKIRKSSTYHTLFVDSGIMRWQIIK